MNDATEPLLPEITPEAEPYWQGGRDGQLLYQRCRDCGGIQFPFQTLCRSCLSTAVEAVPSGGRGTILSFTTIYRAPSPHFADQVPYTVILIKLDEGYTMMSALIDTPPEAVAIGMAAQVAFKPLSPECALPCFKLVANG